MPGDGGEGDAGVARRRLDDRLAGGEGAVLSRRPRSSLLAMRSFTDPNGFWPSSLARMRTSGFGDSTLTSTSGVWPMRSSTLSWTLAM